MSVLDTGLEWAPARTIREAVVGRNVSAVEAVSALLERIATVDEQLHSFFTVASEQALAQAADIDRRIARGEPVGPLAGVPISIKDQFWTRGIRTTGGSLVFADHVPTENAVHVARIRASDGVVVGKTSTPEFGMYWRTRGRVGPECMNPWDTTRTAGGSSGGAAASVAAGLGPLALGSDSGGSIRLPSAMCGVFGVLPSIGRVPRHGAFGRRLFLGSVGPLARDVRDAAVFLGLLAEPFAADPLCRRDAPPDYLRQIEDGVSGLRFGWWEDRAADSTDDPAVVASARDAARRLASLGGLELDEAFELDLMGVDQSWQVLDFVDCYAALGEALYSDPVKRAQLAEYTTVRFDQARQWSATDYSRAVLRRAQFVRSLDELFTRCDLLLSPTTGITAPVTTSFGPAQRVPGIVKYTLPVSFGGYAAATVPCGWVDGLPAGLQIIAGPNQEALLLRACRAFEQAWQWTSERPATEPKERP